jgi:PncC family amidohydrolase
MSPGEGVPGAVHPAVVAAVALRLAELGRWLATAESCTGGLLAHWITSRPGSSAYYKGGVVAYADRAKTALLGVPAGLIAETGAVSAPVAVAMAEGVLARLDADVAVSTTGIAGPSGGTAEKPVGRVYIAVAVRGRQSRVESFCFEGSRAAVQIAAGQAALKMVEDALAV